MITPVSDTLCPVELVEWVYVQIASPEKYLIIEHDGHLQPFITPMIHALRGFNLDRLVATIETGKPAFAYFNPIMTFATGSFLLAISCL